MGARQVGKTHILNEFGLTEYTHCLYLNFEDTPVLSSLFSGSLDPHDIVRVLSIEKQMPIQQHKI